MLSKDDFLEQYIKWYSSAQGSFVLANAIHLSRHMISPWLRRGHTMLVIGFGHWKTLEVLWESGFDLNAIAATEGHVDMVKQHLQHKVEVGMYAFDQLPYDDNSFDYVVLMPPPRSKEYPTLQAMLDESHRLAKKGILLQCWNTLSLAGTLQKFNATPYFLQKSLWSSWTNVYKIMRKLAPNRSISTCSTLLSLPSTWQSSSLFHKANNFIVPLPLGALLQMRLNLVQQAPLTGIPLGLEHIKVGKIQPLTVMERSNQYIKRPLRNSLRKVFGALTSVNATEIQE